jgi:hypothetical protein
MAPMGLRLSRKALMRSVIFSKSIFFSNQFSEEGNKGVQEESTLRKTLIKSTTITGVLVNGLLKLIYRIRSDGTKFNKYGSEVVLIFCALLKLLKLDSQVTIVNLQINYIFFPKSKENNDLIQRIMIGIKLITNPSLFINKTIDFLEKVI